MLGMTTKPVAPVTSPSADVGDILRHLIGDTGRVHDAMGGYKIAVDHTRAFPWDDVFKTLLYRDFRVYVTRHKADIYIEASP
jgi:hypothetical protein